MFMCKCWQGTYCTVYTLYHRSIQVMNSLCKKCPHLKTTYIKLCTYILWRLLLFANLVKKCIEKETFPSILTYFKKNLPPTLIFRHGEKNVTEGGTCWRLWLVLPVIRLLWSAKSCGFLGMLILYLNTLVAQSDHLFRPKNCGDFLNTKAPVSSIGN